jgi:hypothetical protein
MMKAFLRLIVDIAWNECTESSTVPSTEWADRIIAKATAQYLGHLPEGVENIGRAIVREELDPSFGGQDAGLAGEGMATKQLAD